MAECARLAVGPDRKLRVHRESAGTTGAGRAVVSSAESLASATRTLTSSGVMWPTCHQGCDWNE
jgi:hypothetical protein